MTRHQRIRAAERMATALWVITVIALCAAAVGMWSSAASAQHQAPCAALPQALDVLSERHGETPTSRGLNGGNIVLILSNPTSGS